MYYVKTVDLTPEARKRRRPKIPGTDANTPSELTEVVNQRPYKDATIKSDTCVWETISKFMFTSKTISWNGWMPPNRT